MSPRTRAQVGRDVARAKADAMDWQGVMVTRYADSNDLDPFEVAQSLARAGLAFHTDDRRIVVALVVRMRNLRVRR